MTYRRVHANRAAWSPARAGVTHPASACLHARELLLARRELLALEQVPNQRSKFLVRQRRKLQQAGVQPLQLAFRQRVEIDAPNALLDTRTLQPTKENLSGAGIGYCAAS